MKDLLKGYSFLLPLLFCIIAFILVPVLGTIYISFFKDIPFASNEFVLWGNFQELFSDEKFWQSLRFTLLFTLVTVPVEIIIGLVFALVLNQALPFRGILRACFLIPWAIPTAISARIWELIYNYNYGLANFIFSKLGLSEAPINWLGSSAGAFTALVLSDAWKTAPFVAIILLAGLQAVPNDLYAQAQIDRANFWQRFYKITIPLLRPVLMVAILFRTIDALRIFDLIFVLTGGGPGGSTSSLSVYSHQYFLLGDFGYGSAISVILFLISFALAIFYVKATQFEKEMA